MVTVPLFDLATRQANWLAARQSAIASNVANANTQGYEPFDVKPFDSTLDGKSSFLMTTNPAHIQAKNLVAAMYPTQEGENSTVSSGASVNIENELLKEGEVRQAFELNTAITKSFHRMIMSTIRT